MNKTKILIVDDYRENIRALSELVAADDVEIFSASNAEDALEMIFDHEFGLLLLDVQMPGTTGFELAKMIRGVGKYRSLPIIFVTASREDSSVIFEGYRTGAVDLLFKPLNANVVRAKVRMFVELAQQRSLLRIQVDELEKLRKEADAANVAKSQFLANMSHELRTPLAAVLGFSELMVQRHPEDQEAQNLNAGIHRNGQLLMRLIDDILDLSKIEAHKLEIENIEFNLADLIREVQSTMSFRAQEKGLSLVFSTPEKIEHPYLLDPSRLKQIFLNIIGNAIKFTPSGTVNVDIQLFPYSENSQSPFIDRLRILVTDQGVGLSSEQAERLFQPFGQADPSTRRNFGGSGLGLVISRQLARAMGGDVRLVESSPGKGSTFSVEVKMPRAEKSARSEINEKKTANLVTKVTPKKLTGKRILAADDSPDNLTLIKLFLQETEANIEYAENGLEAVEMVRDHDYDLILMDVQMPGMDGNEATRAIRKMGFQKPIIALTAHALKSEQERTRNSGCDSVLTKPMTRNALLEELYQRL